MTDGRTRDTQQGGGTTRTDQPPNFPLQQEVYQQPAAQPPVGRARYGGIAPGYVPGQPDPYFQPQPQPPRDNPPPPPQQRRDNPQPQPGGDPFLQPGNPPQPGRGTPSLQPGGPGGNNGGGRDLQPPGPGQGRYNPNINQDWNTQQPGLAGRPGPHGTSNSGRVLDGVPMSDVARAREQLRRLETGWTLAQAGVAGTTSALFRQPISYGMQSAAAARVEGEGYTAAVARYYQSGYDPIAMHTTAIQRINPQLVSNMASLNRIAELDRGVLAKLGSPATMTAEETAHLANLRRLFGNPENSVLQARLLERENRVWGTAVAEMDAAATSGLVGRLTNAAENGGTVLFSAEEVALLNTRATSLQAKELERAMAIRAGENGGFLTLGGAWNNFRSAFGGTLLSYGVIEADRGVKRYMYGNDFRSWETDGLLVPVAVSAGLTRSPEAALLAQTASREAGWLTRVGPTAGRTLGFTALALGAGHGVDYLSAHGWLPESPTWMPESMRRTTMYDAVPMGLAMTVPVRDWRYRIAAVGTAYVVGNVLDSVCSREAPGAAEDRAGAALRADRNNRTSETMETAVTAFQDLGGRRFALLELAMQQANRNGDNSRNLPLDQQYNTQREIGIIGRALGEYYLSRGSRLDAGSTSTPEYTLRGMDLDLGGEALISLTASRNALATARDLAAGPLRNQSVNGSRVTDQESQDLQRAHDAVQARIDVITGRHNVGESIQQLRNFYRYGTTADGATINKDLAWAKTYIININTHLGRLFPQIMNQGRPDPARNPDATVMVAKLLRDQCMARLAEVSEKLVSGRRTDIQAALDTLQGTQAGRNEILPGMRGPKNYDGIINMLEMAEFLVPNHPDVAEMRVIAERLRTEARNRVNEQYDDPVRNPNSVDRTGNR